MTTYQPGMFEVISFDEKGKELGRSRLKTAYEETMLQVTPETTTLEASSEDLAYIVVNVTDNEGIEGILKMLEEKTVHVKVEGVGTPQGIGSGNPRTTEKYTGTSFTTYHARLIAVVRSGFEKGEIKVTISADGLPEQQVTLYVK